MKKTFPLSLLLLTSMSMLNGMDSKNKKPLDLLAATQSGVICVTQFNQKVAKAQLHEASRDLSPELKLYVLSDPHTKSKTLPFALISRAGYPCFNPDGTQDPMKGYENIQNFIRSLGYTTDQQAAMAFLEAFKKNQEPRSKL